MVPTLADIGQLVWDGFDEDEGEIIYEEEVESDDEEEEEEAETEVEGEDQGTKQDEAVVKQERKTSVIGCFVCIDH